LGSDIDNPVTLAPAARQRHSEREDETKLMPYGDVVPMDCWRETRLDLGHFFFRIIISRFPAADGQLALEPRHHIHRISTAITIISYHHCSKHQQKHKVHSEALVLLARLASHQLHHPPVQTHNSAQRTAPCATTHRAPRITHPTAATQPEQSCARVRRRSSPSTGLASSPTL
jgi:hypothetical protein